MIYLLLLVLSLLMFFFFFKQKTAYEMRISDWSSDVCSSDLQPPPCRTGDHDRDAAQRQHAATEALRRHRRLTAPRTPQLSGVARVSEAHPGWMSNGPGGASLTRATPLPQDNIATNPQIGRAHA